MANKVQLWEDFCLQHEIAEKGVPLFAVNKGVVEVFQYGTNNRNMLKRSHAMETLLIEEVQKVITDYEEETKKYDGLIYLMFWREGDRITVSPQSNNAYKHKAPLGTINVSI